MSRLADVSLSPRQRRILAGIVPVICPSEAVELGLVDAVVDRIELTIRSLPRALRRGLFLGLHTYDLAAAAWPPSRGRASTRLDAERAGRWFDMWWSSRLAPQRELAKALKVMTLMAYYEIPSVKAAIGYTPEAWIEKVKVRRLAVYADDIRRHEESLVERDPLPSSLAARRAAIKEAG